MNLYIINIAQSKPTLRSVFDDLSGVIEALTFTFGLLALMFFLYNLAIYIYDVDSKSLAERKTVLIWSFFATFFLLSVFAVINVLQGFFGISSNAIFADTVHAQPVSNPALPSVAQMIDSSATPIDRFVSNLGIVDGIIISLTALIFAIAILTFLYRLLLFIIKPADKNTNLASYILRSIIILFVMVSFVALIFVVRSFFGIGGSNTNSVNTSSNNTYPAQDSNGIELFGPPTREEFDREAGNSNPDDSNNSRTNVTVPSLQPNQTFNQVGSTDGNTGGGTTKTTPRNNTTSGSNTESTRNVEESSPSTTNQVVSTGGNTGGGTTKTTIRDNTSGNTGGGTTETTPRNNTTSTTGSNTESTEDIIESSPGTINNGGDTDNETQDGAIKESQGDIMDSVQGTMNASGDIVRDCIVQTSRKTTSTILSTFSDAWRTGFGRGSIDVANICD